MKSSSIYIKIVIQNYINYSFVNDSNLEDYDWKNKTLIIIKKFQII